MTGLIPYFEVVKFSVTDDFAIHGFGILVALGFVIGSKVAMTKAARDGLDPEMVNRLVGWLVVGVFVGGHWGHLLMYYPEQILEDPVNIVRFWQGLSSFGGFIGCAVLGVWFFRRENSRVRALNKSRKEAGQELLPRHPVWGYADACLYAFTLGWASGRTGCFVAHDHPGAQTDFVLGVAGMVNPNQRDWSVEEKLAWMQTNAEQFPELASMAVNQAIPAEIWQSVGYHDLGLYEVFWSLGMFALLTVLDKKPRPPGFFVGMVFVAYGPARLIMDLFRHPTTDTRYLGLTPAQYLSVAMVAVGFWILWANKDKPSIRTAMAERKAQGLPLPVDTSAAILGDGAAASADDGAASG